MSFTGDKLVASALTSNNQDAVATTTSTTYTPTLTGGTAAGVAFVVPPSGIVLIMNTSGIGPGGPTDYRYCDFEIRTGGVVGSGTVFRSPTDNTAMYARSDWTRFTVITEISGLTVGATYNVRQFFRTTAGTLNTQSRRVNVLPVP